MGRIGGKGGMGWKPTAVLPFQPLLPHSKPYTEGVFGGFKMRDLLRFLGLAVLALGLTSASALAAAPTFSKDVAPIVFAKCAECHRPGSMAPMSLMTYEDARPW